MAKKWNEYSDFGIFIQPISRLKESDPLYYKVFCITGWFAGLLFLGGVLKALGVDTLGMVLLLLGLAGGFCGVIGMFFLSVKSFLGSFRSDR